MHSWTSIYRDSMIFIMLHQLLEAKVNNNNKKPHNIILKSF